MTTTTPGTWCINAGVASDADQAAAPLAPPPISTPVVVPRDSGTRATAALSRATIDVSADDGATWDTVHVVAASDTWVPLEIDLAAYLGERVRVRLIFDAVAASPAAPADTWRVEHAYVELE